MIDDLPQHLSRGINLTIDQITDVINELLSGTQTDQNIAEFLKILTQKGKSVENLLAMLNKMGEYCLHISPN